METRQEWNRAHNDRRIGEKTDQRTTFRKDDFAPESPRDRIPFSTYEHQSIQEVEKNFISARDNQETTAEQLQEINALQNQFRDYLRTIGSVRSLKDHKDGNLHKYATQVSVSVENEQWTDQVLAAVAQDFTQRIAQITNGKDNNV